MKTWHKLAVSGASALAIATALAGYFEGNRLHAYHDVGGVPTICYGHTQGVAIGDTATPAQCTAQLRRDMAQAMAGVRACIRRPMTRNQEAAFGDLAFNIGVARFCRSSVAREFNAGDARGACAAILAYNKADHRVLRGLEKRRQADYELCSKP